MKEQRQPVQLGERRNMDIAKERCRIDLLVCLDSFLDWIGMIVSLWKWFSRKGGIYEGKES